MKTYENYPASFVAVANLVQLSIYAISAYIMYQFGALWLWLFLLYVGWLEYRLLRHHCVDCYYYGKYCAFGKGKLSSLFFKKGDAKKFCKMTITWKDILPDFLVSIVPMLLGVVLLVGSFSWMMVALVVALLLLAFAGNGFVRSELACKYCKQREIGCPAQKLFEEPKK